ncbi:hypothetical protein PIB30_007437 [Stylosanthes scabra]|uniref:Uncharacterized protein n=1 Tax=Stylosanthes scabra TaxID=79078 RepID=A0ABU6R5Q4_9FABA|nr:hypothetical protein [Stylosanthes scabra]
MATGRFSNGKMLVDLLATQIQDKNITWGVNYASAATGILDEIGRHLSLYDFGLRKFLLAAIGPLGCIPNQISRGLFPTGTYKDEVSLRLIEHAAALEGMEE